MENNNIPNLISEITNPNLSPEEQRGVELLIKLDSCGEQKITAQNAKFRIQNQKLFLTYKTHINKAEYKTWFTELSNGIKSIEMAHETGLSKMVPYEHTHVLIDFGRNFQTTRVTFFDYKNIHPNIRLVKTKKHWDNCENYLAKEDPENEHLRKTATIADAVWSCASLQEALRICETPGDALGITSLYSAKQREKIVRPKPEPWFPWHETLDTMLLEKPNHYTLDWIFDPMGMQGKTTYAQWKKYEDPAHYTIIYGACSAYHLATLMETKLSNGWEGHCVFFNLTRSAENNKTLYNAIEQIKDGDLSAIKYKGGDVEFNRPHVIILANFLPDLRKLSIKRWNILMIWNTNLVKLELNYVFELMASDWYKDLIGKQEREKSLLEFL
nr:MAG: replication associated protein [Cressdnaviricota sp.]